MKRTVYFYLIAALTLSIGGLNAQAQETVEYPKLSPGCYSLEATVTQEWIQEDTWKYYDDPKSFARILLVEENSVGHTIFLEAQGQENTHSCGGTIGVYFEDENQSPHRDSAHYEVSIDTSCYANDYTEADDFKYEEALLVEKSEFESWMRGPGRTAELSGVFLRAEGPLRQKGYADLKPISQGFCGSIR